MNTLIRYLFFTQVFEQNNPNCNMHSNSTDDRLSSATYYKIDYINGRECLLRFDGFDFIGTLILKFSKLYDEKEYSREQTAVCKYLSNTFKCNNDYLDTDVLVQQSELTHMVSGQILQIINYRFNPFISETAKETLSKSVKIIANKSDLKDMSQESHDFYIQQKTEAVGSSALRYYKEWRVVSIPTVSQRDVSVNTIRRCLNREHPFFSIGNWQKSSLEEVERMFESNQIIGT